MGTTLLTRAGRCSFAPPGLRNIPLATHGSRRGLHSYAAPRLTKLVFAPVYLFVYCPEDMPSKTCAACFRCVSFSICVYGYVVMPEHVHLLVSEPERGLLGDAVHYLKLVFGEEVKGFNHGGHRGSQGKSAGSLQVRAHKTGAKLGH